MPDQPAPVRKSELPCMPPPEWEFFRIGDPGELPIPGDNPRMNGHIWAIVRRRVTYGDWEPVRPDHWAEEEPVRPVVGLARGGRYDEQQLKVAWDDASAGPTAPGGLRDQYAAAIYERNNPTRRWADAHPDDLLAYAGDADAVLAVRDQELTHFRALLAEAVEWIHEGELRERICDALDPQETP
ncbi:hypothetical protein [Streptomyces sp. NPDC002994]|uniref:hypothetical protein n=1 Tax=Streptomyces sp. NPDC002994 TaxID=3154441 RepID=UPI0033B44F71